MTEGTTITNTHYLDGFQYVDDDLEFFPHAEGYVKHMLQDNGPLFNYVYNYTDHLGNIRLRYAQDPQTQALTILEEDHYYPFGLKHKGYESEHKIFEFEESSSTVVLIPITPDLTERYKYKYNGKELQSEFGIEMYDFGARNYDPALGRWMNIDPLAANYLSHSPYHYTYNNPVRFIDPDGRKVVDKNGNEVGVTINSDEDGNKTASFTFAEGTKKSVIRHFNRNGGKVINSMVNSEKGEELVNEVVASEDNISINLSSKTELSKAGSSRVTSINYKVENGEAKEVNKNIEVTIYGGTIDLLRRGSNLTTEIIELGQKTQDLVDMWKNNNLTRDQVIGSVGGHEFYHALHHTGGKISEEEHQKARDAEQIIIQEFGLKNKKQ